MRPPNRHVGEGSKGETPEQVDARSLGLRGRDRGISRLVGNTRRRSVRRQVGADTGGIVRPENPHKEIEYRSPLGDTKIWSQPDLRQAFEEGVDATLEMLRKYKLPWPPADSVMDSTEWILKARLDTKILHSNAKGYMVFIEDSDAV